MSSPLVVTVLAATIAFGAVRPAAAGIADSPLPVLEPGKSTLHLYSVPGVIINGGVAAYFSCTSTDSAPMKVSVELFGALGGGPASDAASAAVTVAPGGSVLFGTTSPLWNPGIASTNGSHTGAGSARILATSKKLACTAFMADPSNIPPIFTNPLTIIAKLKQKAAN